MESICFGKWRNLIGADEAGFALPGCYESRGLNNQKNVKKVVQKHQNEDKETGNTGKG